MRLWVLMRIRAVSPDPSLFAHMKYGNRRRVRTKIRHLALLDGCARTSEELRRIKCTIISWHGMGEVLCDYKFYILPTSFTVAWIQSVDTLKEQGKNPTSSYRRVSLRSTRSNTKAKHQCCLNVFIIINKLCCYKQKSCKIQIYDYVFFLFFFCVCVNLMTIAMSAKGRESRDS